MTTAHDVDPGQVTILDSAVSLTDASTIGLPPGNWPTLLRVGELRYHRGAPYHYEGDLVSVTYIDAATGHVLRVFND